MARVYLGLGSNLDPEKHLRMAVGELRRRFGKVELSPVYRNCAVGFAGADFVNLVASIETPMSPSAILDQLSEIHDLSGRKRGGDKFSSRTLDIDLLLYDDLVLDDPPLRLPRKDVLEYSFVLRPLAELAGELRHPVTGRRIADHWSEFDAGRHPLEKLENLALDDIL